MLINPLTAAMGAIELFSDLTSHHAKKDKEKDPLTQLTSPDSYNVNHMSFNDLNAMTLTLMEQGKLSSEDGQNFFKQINSIQQTSGIPKDQKIDMIQMYQQQIQNLGPNAGAKDLVSLERSLDFLSGIKARAGATIPQFV
ncbi:hypothetical protein [Legionella sp. km772]|uniref:hypothetical protein n=1 Tax=Legionella sp. km772 TaxID=2498111 RepID=UPI000F8DED1E|nr:hypothetical protein [Legionella sp. km772]RUR13735.1 hypothetical protein ELY15_01520 [Legionella sp. km772]